VSGIVLASPERANLNFSGISCIRTDSAVSSLVKVVISAQPVAFTAFRA
jgi:hypothetical protein